ncbi:MAG TPA: hypothetical protein VF553_00205 [Pyrinomonadaceae bacterium]
MSRQFSSNDESAQGGLDWRAQISEHPLAFSAGALAAGFLVGYGLGGALPSSSSERRSPGSLPRATMGGADGVPAHEELHLQDTLSGISGQGASYLGGDQDWPQTAASSKPGLVEKFKNTQAFDRLQAEVSKLGERLLSELSRVGQEVVLPALTGKIKEMVGVDVSAQQAGAQGNRAQGTGTI